jgi:formylmethanofuran dehydrogenase subunit E
MHKSNNVKPKEKGEGKMFAIPEWMWEFHGHRCPFMPIGYRMGKVAMEKLGMSKVKDHGAFALSEMGVGHPQTCMMDGIQAITGCTYGKLMMERLNYGKVAMVLHSPGKGSVRVSALPEFLDELGKKEFFAFRKKGIEPSDIPPSVVEDAVRLVLDLPEEKMFKVENLEGFKFSRPKSSFNKAKCSACGEYVFERYLRVLDGKQTCIPCAEKVIGAGA